MMWKLMCWQDFINEDATFVIILTGFEHYREHIDVQTRFMGATPRCIPSQIVTAVTGFKMVPNNLDLRCDLHPAPLTVQYSTVQYSTVQYSTVQ